MRKRELAQQLAQKHGLPVNRVEAVLNDLRDHILETLRDENVFSWRGLGNLRAVPYKNPVFNSPRVGGKIVKHGARRASFQLAVGARAFIERSVQEKKKNAADPSHPADGQ
ncbi:HU family DNA-binding protein [Burkholderia sp. MBR-1]|uniref:HU family DNA-binding protein n=1 Tax=Burkholderia sp. MBR-1 TaxID=2732364 RepID=UPI0015EE4A55|nr:hypothetical protein MBR110_29875 [Burkholderia sp. MBR-1]